MSTVTTGGLFVTPPPKKKTNKQTNKQNTGTSKLSYNVILKCQNSARTCSEQLYNLLVYDLHSRSALINGLAIGLYNGYKTMNRQPINVQHFRSGAEVDQAYSDCKSASSCSEVCQALYAYQPIRHCVGLYIEIDTKRKQWKSIGA